MLGSAGAICPLLASTGLKPFEKWAPLGYPLLTAAGACLVVNQLFGATGGHVRYVTAQIELESALTAFRLKWAQWLASRQKEPLCDEDVKQAFDILTAFSADSYRTIQAETNVWGKSVSEALEDYAKRITGKSGQSDGANPWRL